MQNVGNEAQSETIDNEYWIAAGIQEKTRSWVKHFGAHTIEH